MNTVNIIIIGLLFLSPIIYIPLIINKKQRGGREYVWYTIMFLLGLKQILIYLIIILALKIPI